MPLPADDLLPADDVFPGDLWTQLALDPSELVGAYSGGSYGTGVYGSAAGTDRTELALNDGPIRVAPPGPDWGEAQIQAYMADMARGELPVSFRIPNRQVRIPLLLGADGPDGFTTALSELQSKVARIQAEGGWLRRDAGRYADVMNATLVVPEEYRHLGVQSEVVLTLECLPDFYGAEIQLDDHSETALPELVFTEQDVQGDYPGRLRIVIDNDSDVDQLSLLAGIRSRHYSPEDTARLAYGAEELTPLDTAVAAALAGASGSGDNTVLHDNLGICWTPVLNTNLLDGTFLTHTGSYRVYARVETTSGTPPALRFVWDVGDLALPTENKQAAIPGSDNLYIVDLGEIRLDPTVGIHRWQGQIQGKGAAGGENVYIDRLWLVPLDEGACKLRAPINLAQGLTPAIARDEFNQTAGNLNGKAAAVGGNWATTAPGGGADLAVSGASVVTRDETGETDLSGRFALVGTLTPSLVVIQVDFAADNWDSMERQALVARYIDTDNWLALMVRGGGGSEVRLEVTKCLGGGGAEVLNPLPPPSLPTVDDAYYTARMVIDAQGRYLAWLFPQGGLPGTVTATGVDSDLATGGTLESGKIGIYDQGDLPCTRSYDNFVAYVPAVDAVAFAGQSVQVGSGGNWREDATGTAYGPVSIPGGDLLRLPPSGLEGRAAEVFVKLSRGDLDQLPDSGIDPVSARAYYRPSYLFP